VWRFPRQKRPGAVKASGRVILAAILCGGVGDFPVISATILRLSGDWKCSGNG
jgi:hypothetical protein